MMYRIKNGDGRYYAYITDEAATFYVRPSRAFGTISKDVADTVAKHLVAFGYSVKVVCE